MVGKLYISKGFECFLCSLSLSLLFKLELLSDISRLWNVPLIISWTQWGVTKLEPSLKFHLKDPLREEQYAHKSLNVVFRPHGRLSGRKYFAKNERMKHLLVILNLALIKIFSKSYQDFLCRNCGVVWLQFSVPSH